MYTSASIALAILETLVWLDKSEVPADYVVMAIAFDFHSAMPRFLDSNEGLRSWTPGLFRSHFYMHPVMEAQSIIVMRESNYILLPEGEGFNASISWIEDFRFDERLFRALASSPPPSAWNPH